MLIDLHIQIELNEKSNRTELVFDGVIRQAIENGFDSASLFLHVAVQLAISHALTSRIRYGIKVSVIPLCETRKSQMHKVTPDNEML